MILILICLLPVLFSWWSTPENPDTIPPSGLRITRQVVNEDFGGVGFHVFYHVHNAPRWHYDQVFAKRWRELNPSFVRINDDPEWTTGKLDSVASYLEVMKSTGTEMYFTSWGTQAIRDYSDERDYVRKEVDNLEYLKRIKGFDRINYYCMANELSLDHWASMVDDLEYFKRIHSLFYEEIERRNLDIRLLSTDASPFRYWHTIEWAAENMDEITGVYGGHHYINEYDIFDPSFYRFFLDKMLWGSGLAKSRGKRFIVGEFGSKQNSNDIDGVRHDAMLYNNTPLESYAAIQSAEAILAMINGGIYGSNYWTFSDFPSAYRNNYINKWGLFRWEVDNFTTKPGYYCIGLLCKFFRGPSTAYQIQSADTLLRAVALRNQNREVSIAVINRHPDSRAIAWSTGELTPGKPFRKYLFDPADPPFNYFGDLQEPSAEIEVTNGSFTDTVPSMGLVVYTTLYDTVPPAPVKGLRVEARKIDNRDRNVLTWQPSPEADFCYYRIYRGEHPGFELSPERQHAVTIATEYIDQAVHNLPPKYYRVVAVDQSGNASDGK